MNNSLATFTCWWCWRWCFRCGGRGCCGGCCSSGGGSRRSGGSHLRAEAGNGDDCTEWPPSRLPAGSGAHNEAARTQVLVAGGGGVGCSSLGSGTGSSPELDVAGPTLHLIKPIVAVRLPVTLQAPLDAFAVKATDVVLRAAVLVPGIWTLGAGVALVAAGRVVSAQEGARLGVAGDGGVGGSLPHSLHDAQHGLAQAVGARRKDQEQDKGKHFKGKIKGTLLR